MPQSGTDIVELACQPDARRHASVFERPLDFLFAAGRAVNDNGDRAVLWYPAKPVIGDIRYTFLYF